MRIRFIPTYPVSIAYGGQEVVQETLVDRLGAQQPDWDVAQVDFAKREPLSDVYHIVGNSSSLQKIVSFIPQDIPIVLSVIDGVRDDQRIKRVLKRSLHWVSKHFQEETSYGQLSQLFGRMNKVLPLNARAATFVQSRYGIDDDRIEIVPNGASSAFFERPDVAQRGILISGSIIHRKATHEAISFGESPAGQSYHLHFVGGTQNNEMEYGTDCIERISRLKNATYHGYVAQHSDVFWQIFDSCRYLLQLSFEETQSLSALEAIAGGKRCVFRRAPYSLAPPFDGCQSVTQTTPEQIDAALRAAESAPVERNVVKSWDEIAQQLVRIYRELHA